MTINRTESRFSVPHIVMCGTGSGLLGALCTHPLKVIRYCQQRNEQTIRVAARNILQSRGFTGLYRGLLPELGQVVSRGFVGWPIIVQGPKYLESYIGNLYYQQMFIGVTVSILDGIVTHSWEQKKIRRATGDPLPASRWCGWHINCANRCVKLTTLLTAQEYFSRNQPTTPTFYERLKVGMQVTATVALVSTPLDRINTLTQAGLLCSSTRPSWRGMLLYMLPLGINTMLSSLLLGMFQKDAST